ncbi:hypothetical protein NT6N_27820 [Oceaniferula spumae]|uniref:Ice-binding protein C-terminal domain-containing protein n=1 Tax=Oceaniferula spumae TaxID=2979115 RepID=A0AAT9FPB5_9BACT
MKIHQLIPTLGAAALTIASSQAAITYVDAVEGTGGNTRATGSTQADASWRVDNTSPDAGTQYATQWSERPYGNTSIFQALPTTNGTPTGIPELTTTISLADGIYDLYVFYWDQTVSDTQNWVISTGLTSGALTTYSSPGNPAVTGATTTGVVDASTLTYAGTAPITDEGGVRELFAVKFENVTVTGGSADIFVDYNLSHTGNNRAWYDGVGYEVVPEPSSTALLGLGGLALILRRRR